MEVEMITFKRITGGPAVEAGPPDGAVREHPYGEASGWAPAASNGGSDGNGDAPTESPARAQRLFEPPSGFVAQAITRHKLLVCACALVFALAGVAIGIAHRRTFTSSATLQVGQVNPNSPGFYGYVQSAAALATAFSRAIDAEPVLSTIQARLRLAPAAAIERLSAEPLPSSPAFRVIATGPSESDAVRLANVASAAIIAYEGQSNSANPAAAALLHEYHEASLALQRAETRVARLQRDKRTPTSALQSAEVARSTVSVRLRAIENAYNGAVISQAPRSGLVSLLAGATSASSDHKSKIELYGFVGLLLGVAAGCLAAVARRRRSARRTSPANVEIDPTRPEPA
jgi:uncharacterized protein involved in exopolysaccharide biosynthesis